MMDTRLFGYLTFAFIMMLIYQAWMQDYVVPAQTAASVTQVNTDKASASPAEDLPQASIASAATTNTNSVAQVNAATVPVIASEPSNNADVVSSASQQIHVRTDTLDVLIDTRGGTIVQADLLNYPQEVNKPELPVRLFNTEESTYYVAQSGLIGTQQNGNNRAPTHHAVYQAPLLDYRLENEKLEVPLTWRSEDGIEITKTYIFHKNSHVIEIAYSIKNNSTQAWQGQAYTQLQRRHVEQGYSLFGIYTYTGGVIYSAEKKYEKRAFSKLHEEPIDRDVTNGWVAVIEHYFLSAWLPTKDQPQHAYSKVIGDTNPLFVVGMKTNIQEIAAGASAQIESRLYVGPKEHERLEVIAPFLDLTVDYGWLTFVSKPLFLALNWIENYVGNWGWAIVILTIVIKLAFYKLSEAQYRSMAKMRKVQPKLMAIRDRYKDDRQRQGVEMMELYKKEKINPLGGCLPMIIQIPVFIALYWVLLESVELRQAPFMLWIKDMSAKDPYFILPLIMGVTMYIQQKLNPAPLDPIQAKVFMVLPFVFTVMFAFFPAGLVLYWVTNNTITIIQQWYITNRVLKD
ncbi:MAG: membrane protein insertase YidC [Gammaproteobacteria bacterium]|nr:membrane protein insertase YidC [Gammaproteobacteria bacterium]